MKDKKKQNGRRKPRGGGFEISAITVSYSPPPDAPYRLRRIITMMIKHAARDRRAALGENDTPNDPQAEYHAEADE